MIEVVPATGTARRDFERVAHEVYRPYPQHRSTEEDVVRLVCGGRAAYHRHADVRLHLLREGARTVGRVALIHDRNLPAYVQAAFFEALPGLQGVDAALREAARRAFPGVPRLVVGLNGHLNYSAGLLLGPHDLAPIFGFPYTPPYYAEYFAALSARTMVSFRFDAQPFYDFAHRFGEGFDPSPIRVRTMDRRQLRRDVALYTELNNACFGEHPYWSNRAEEEDYELFHPFRWLLKEENLIFAELDGRAVGFLLWYPDFNELVRKPHAELGVLDVLRYQLGDYLQKRSHVAGKSEPQTQTGLPGAARLRRASALRNPIETVRLTEIAVRAEHRHGPAVPAMILQMIRSVERGGYKFCEGGFIFEENRGSMGMTLKYIARAFGRELTPTRRFAVYEAELT